MEYQELLNEFTDACKTLLQDKLTGVYLHGSMAMGCFNAAKSDIDIIVIVDGEISDGQKMELMRKIVALNGEAPAKGLEISFVQKKYCKPFVYPTPFELHFSMAHLKWFQDNPEDYIEKMKGEDADLAAHFTIMNQYGIKLCGEEIVDVFGTVPREDYADSVWRDIENAAEDILENPVYIILNLCRVLACFKADLVLSKEKGGEWGLQNAGEEYRSLISQALSCYKSDRTMVLDEAIAERFVDAMLGEIKKS